MQMSMQMNDGNNDPNRLLALFLTSPENKENKIRLYNGTYLRHGDREMRDGSV